MQDFVFQLALHYAFNQSTDLAKKDYWGTATTNFFEKKNVNSFRFHFVSSRSALASLHSAPNFASSDQPIVAVAINF